MNQNRSVILVFASALLSACATVAHGTDQLVSIGSVPWQATVTVDGKAIGKTPVAAQLSRAATHTIKIEFEGYEPVELKTHRRISGWAYWNLLWVIFCPVPIAIDALSGGLFYILPIEVATPLVLRAKPGAAAAARQGIKLRGKGFSGNRGITGIE